MRLKAKRGQAFCDDCLQEKTGVDRHEVNTIASTLALFPQEFERKQRTCPHGCSSREKFVTRAT
jgi:hypothetical protein